MARADVLLATYNGAPRLPALLDSLERQTFSGWRLIHRDDGSTDGSTQIVAEWARRSRRPFLKVEDERGNLGAMMNFAALLEVADSAYFLPCDQDDIWEPEKIALLCERITAREAVLGVETPLIVHSDLVVVDDGLSEIHPSFWRHQRLILPREWRPWTLLTLQNSITGCAMIGNTALRHLALPVPESAIMHDWWLALVAACFGAILSEPQPTMRYRQHDANTLGAKDWSTRAGIQRILADPLAAARRAHKAIATTQTQAAVFFKRYEGRMSPDQRAFFYEYVALPQMPFLMRKSFPVRHSLWFDDVIRNVGMLAVI